MIKLEQAKRRVALVKGLELPLHEGHVDLVLDRVFVLDGLEDRLLFGVPAVDRRLVLLEPLEERVHGKVLDVPGQVLAPVGLDAQPLEHRDQVSVAVFLAAVERGGDQQHLAGPVDRGVEVLRLLDAGAEHVDEIRLPDDVAIQQDPACGLVLEGLRHRRGRRRWKHWAVGFVHARASGVRSDGGRWGRRIANPWSGWKLSVPAGGGPDPATAQGGRDGRAGGGKGKGRGSWAGSVASRVGEHQRAARRNLGTPACCVSGSVLS